MVDGTKTTKTKGGARRPSVVVSTGTHERLKTVAGEHGMKLGELSDRILATWLEGDQFCLPATLRRR